MKIETHIKQSISAGMLFTITNDGNHLPYIFIESAHDDDDMTPCKIVDLVKGIVLTRSTSWKLALSLMGVSLNEISLEGHIKIPFGVEY